MQSRLDDFVGVVVKSGLVKAEMLDEGLARATSGQSAEAPVRLARWLIERGALTSYQARKLLEGVSKGFFLGGCRILRRLGQGGMGKVYLAVRESDGERVAIKVLPPKKALEEAHALARFRREMDLSRRIKHPNIARTLDVGAEDGVHFMIMEYVPGDSLYNIVRSDNGGPLRVTDAARYFLKVVDGLNAAHDAGLVHRDVKPSNMMVTPDGDAKLLDLGLARAIGEESPLTRPNIVIGTLDYASPEQLADAAKADRRSDLYSLGCTLYFTLSGRPPFEGGDVINKMFKQRMDEPPPLEKITPGVPTAFAAIVRKLMAKDPEDRYQDGHELLGDLTRWTDPRTVRALLGSEAESARAFRPPAPRFDDEDLRLGLDEDPSQPSLSLRDLGAAEPKEAPLHRPPPPPRPAVYLNTALHSDDELSALPAPPAADTRWLMLFVAAAALLGALAILAFT